MYKARRPGHRGPCRLLSSETNPVEYIKGPILIVFL